MCKTKYKKVFLYTYTKHVFFNATSMSPKTNKPLLIIWVSRPPTNGVALGKPTLDLKKMVEKKETWTLKRTDEKK